MSGLHLPVMMSLKRRLVCIYLCTFLIVLPCLCLVLQLHHSVYCKLLLWLRHHLNSAMHVDIQRLTRLLWQNDARIHAATLTLNKTTPVSTGTSGQVYTTRPTSGSGISVHITVISSGRQFVDEKMSFTPRYATQNIGQFRALIDRFQQQQQQQWTGAVTPGPAGSAVNYVLSVCSVGDELTSEEQFLSHYVTVWRRERSAATFGPFHDRLAWRYEQEKRDYMACLEHTVAQDGDFILVVEDDALPLDGTLDVVRRLVLPGFWTSSNPRSNFATHYVKLYHPLQLHSYLCTDSWVECLLQLVALSLLTGTLLYWAAASIWLVHSTAVWVQACVYCCHVALCIGRPHLDTVWRLWLQSSPALPRTRQVLLHTSCTLLPTTGTTTCQLSRDCPV